MSVVRECIVIRKYGTFDEKKSKAGKDIFIIKSVIINFIKIQMPTK